MYVYTPKSMLISDASVMVYIWYNTFSTWHLRAPYLYVFHWFLRVTRELITCHFTHNQNDTPMQKNNVSKFSKCEPHHKHKQGPQDIVWHKPYSN